MAEPGKLARCPRCKAYGLVAESQGIRVALDIAPVDAVGYGRAVTSGVGLWWVENVQGRGSRVLKPFSGTPMPSWGAGGAQEGAQRLHAEHSCGAPARDMVIVPVSAPKGSAPATPGAAGAGSHHRAAPVASASGPVHPSPATIVTLRLSDATRCNICRQPIAHGEGVGIDCGTYSWWVHAEDCP